MIDVTAFTVRAGDGGNGRVSFRHEKYAPKGGPDGGNGGDGGSIIIRASSKLHTLHQYAGKTEFVAQNGQLGGRKKQTGAKGESVVLEVPLGTIVWVYFENQTAQSKRTKLGFFKYNQKDKTYFHRYQIEKEGQSPEPRIEDQIKFDCSAKEINDWNTVKSQYLHQPQKLLLSSFPKIKAVEMLEEGQEVVIAQGGFGGRGNDAFKGPHLTTPLTAEYATQGEQRFVVLELQLLADIGLVGYPNAGKSTLLSVITKARPKIASYPFTTLEPQLGVFISSDGKRELMVADIPGLIEGANRGKGLGHAFLRHIEHCKVILFVLFLDEEKLFDTSLSPKDKAVLLWGQYEQLMQELKEYDKSLAKRTQLISVSKSDLYDSDTLNAINEYFDAKNTEVELFSSVSHKGLDSLSKRLFDIFE